jgi:hypothetical protein
MSRPQIESQSPDEDFTSFIVASSGPGPIEMLGERDTERQDDELKEFFAAVAPTPMATR